VIKNALAADWVVYKPEVGMLIVELKGSAVEHAIKQVEATARYLVANNWVTGKLGGLIVANTYPKAGGAVQKAQASFAKNFHAPLHVVTRNTDYLFEKVLAFDGPH
jgi:hypothetical protein